MDPEVSFEILWEKMSGCMELAVPCLEVLDLLIVRVDYYAYCQGRVDCYANGRVRTMGAKS